MFRLSKLSIYFWFSPAVKGIPIGDLRKLLKKVNFILQKCLYTSNNYQFIAQKS